MDVQIHSFESIEEAARSPFPENTLLISVGDTGAPPPRLAHKPRWMLRLVFDDIYPDEIERGDIMDGDTVFGESQAQQIAEFIAEHIGEAGTIICQCEYGQSRSAAIAAAIKEHYEGNGIEIFADYRYYPNKLVYKILIKALNKV